jgi:inosose dehydratase
MSAYRIANAPCSWGVDFADHPANPPWRQVLDDAAAAGYRAIDLGPVGYFPTDLHRLADELSSRGLGLSTGVLFDPLADPTAFPAVVEKTRRTCEILRFLEAPRLVIIDCVSEERGRTAGQTSAARRLDDPSWRGMMDRITEIARIAHDDYGVVSTLHPHGGCFVEFEDEVDRAMDDLSPELVGLCVDTGHSAYAGIDPAALIRRYGGRLWHMHFKDIDPAIRAKCLAEGTDFFSAIARGIFCPLGRGMVDFDGVRDALADVGYEGLVVVEQDVDPAGDASPLKNARESYAYLASVGLAA